MNSAHAAGAIFGALLGAALAALLITCLITRVTLFIFLKLVGRTPAAPFLSFAVSAGLFLTLALVRNNLLGFVIIPLPCLILWLLVDLVRLSRKNAISES
jgi:hypothetical protein